MALKRSRYRPVKPFSHQLRETSCVYFDDGLYLEAMSFLSNLLSSGTSVPDRTLPAYVPFPQQLGLLSTLVVHPTFTTRASSAERLQASNSALRLLHDVNKIVGPVNVDLANAFAFHSLRVSRRGGKRRGGDDESEDGEDVERMIRSELANSGSLFAQSESFWDVVGWAFNCSVVHKKRWERWRLWLELMLDALEDDWAERIREADEKRAETGNSTHDAVAQSLILQYLPTSDGRMGRRRTMRAILANGDKRSLNEFREVFRNETAERKQEESTKSRLPRQINIDEGDFGDYGLDDDDEDDMVDGGVDLRTSTRTTRRDEPAVDEEFGDGNDEGTLRSSDHYALGGVDSIVLRQRLLSLLHRVAVSRPKLFTDEGDLFDLFTEFMRPLPLTSFDLLLTSSKLDHVAQISLQTNLLLPLLSPRPPVYDDQPVTQSDLEQYFLPYAANANSNVDNAKTSLVLEALMMALFTSSGLQPTETLGAAVEEGIRARKQKAIGDARRKGKGKEGEELEARRVLDLSEERLMALLEVIESG